MYILLSLKFISWHVIVKRKVVKRKEDTSVLLPWTIDHLVMDDHVRPPPPLPPWWIGLSQGRPSRPFSTTILLVDAKRGKILEELLKHILKS